MVKKGRVVSAKQDKTIVVEVERLIQHPLYKKYITRKSKFYAHDEKEEAKEGDLVEIESTKPISKLKRWRLINIVETSGAGK